MMIGRAAHQHHPVKFYVLMVMVPLLGVLYLGAALKWGVFTVDASGATQIMNTRPANGEGNVLPNAFISADLNPGNAIDPESIDSTSVRLYRTSDGIPVAAVANTSAAGDSLVLTPQELLDNDTSYTFEVTDALLNVDGEHVLPFKMSFTTGSGTGGAGEYPVAFEKVLIPGDNEMYTSLTIGPDERLYAAGADGKITRFELGPDGRPNNAKIIQTIITSNHAARTITGIRFDPASTHDDLRLWVSHGQSVSPTKREVEGADNWTGKISVLSGPELGTCRDVVVGLPRSARDHLNNQLDFGPDGAIYFTQGSHTAMGANDPKWGTRGERLLSAAVLRVDVSTIPGTLDVKTDEGGSYDPFAEGAPLTIYASGVRVGFDVLWHRNGHLYTAINGSAAGGSVPSTPLKRSYPRRVDQDTRGPYDGPDVPGMSVPETQDDLLLKIVKGAYYGHPNPMRAEYVLNGGNPSVKVDPFEVRAYPVGTLPDRNWRMPAFDFGKNVSPNGLIEFKGKQFDGALDGKLLVTRFSGGKDIMILSLNDQGDVVESITGVAGLTQFVDPLDLCLDAAHGFIYVAEYAGRRLTLLRPVEEKSRAASMSGKVFRQRVEGGTTLQALP